MGMVKVYLPQFYNFLDFMLPQHRHVMLTVRGFFALHRHAAGRLVLWLMPEGRQSLSLLIQ